MVWESVSVAPGAGVDEVVLQDVSTGRLARIAAVIEGLRAERDGRGPPVSTTTSLEAAVDGARAVFCAIRVGGLEGRILDETVAMRSGVLGQETVGPGGIAFALRTVPVMLRIAGLVEGLAPDAWFLNFTNPAGLVTEAIRPVLGNRVVGVCDYPAALCARVAGAVGLPMRSLRFDYAGLNHLGWLMGVRDAGGHDLMPALLDDRGRLGRLEEARLFGPARLRELGMIPNEYLVYWESPSDVVREFRRDGVTRAQILAAQQSRFYGAHLAGSAEALAAWRDTRDARHGTYMAEAWGHAQRAEVWGVDDEVPVDEGPGEAGYAAIAASFLRAANPPPSGPGEQALILNVPNKGRLPFLDDEAVVEIPCAVGPGGPRPLEVGTLPDRQRELVARVKEVERLTIRAAVEGSRRLALEALAAHPVVPSREAAEAILAGYLAEQPGLREALR